MEEERQERSWRSWSDLAQRAILAYIVLDLGAYVVAALPGGLSLAEASMGGFFIFVDVLLIRLMIRWASRIAVGVSFAIALMSPATYFLSLLPLTAFNGFHPLNVAYNLAFCIPEVILLGIALGAADREEPQDAIGVPSGAVKRTQSTP